MMEVMEVNVELKYKDTWDLRIRSWVAKDRTPRDFHRCIMAIETAISTTSRESALMEGICLTQMHGQSI